MRTLADGQRIVYVSRFLLRLHAIAGVRRSFWSTYVMPHTPFVRFLPEGERKHFQQKWANEKALRKCLVRAMRYSRIVDSLRILSAPQMDKVCARWSAKNIEYGNKMKQKFT